MLAFLGRSRTRYPSASDPSTLVSMIDTNTSRLSATISARFAPGMERIMPSRGTSPSSSSSCSARNAFVAHLADASSTPFFSDSAKNETAAFAGPSRDSMISS